MMAPQEVETMTTAALIAQVEAATDTAYSWDRYSRGGWRAAIRGLLTMGYAPEVVTEIMLSKIPRWAADGCSAPWGRVPGRVVVAMVQRHPEWISAQGVRIW